MTTAEAPPAPLPAWVGCCVCDRDGAPLGHVADVLFDVHTRAPGWLALTPLDPRAPVALVPAQGLRHHVGGVRLACTRAAVERAPASPAPPGELGREQAPALAAHYGVRRGAGPWEGVAEPASRRTADAVLTAA